MFINGRLRKSASKPASIGPFRLASFSFQLRRFRPPNPCLELRHSSGHIVLPNLDVGLARRRHIGVTQNPLDGQVRNPEFVQIAAQASPQGVPAVPRGKIRTSGVFVIRVRVFLPGLAALPARAEDRVDLASEEIVQANRRGDLRREHDTGRRIAKPQAVQIEQPKYGRDGAVKLIDGLAGESPASADCPVGTVVISGDGAGDQTVESSEVKVLVS